MEMGWHFGFSDGVVYPLSALSGCVDWKRVESSRRNNGNDDGDIHEHVSPFPLPVAW